MLKKNVKYCKINSMDITKEKLDLIINENAGGMTGEKVKQSLPIIKEHLTARGVRFELHMVSKPHEAKFKTAELIDNGATIIVSVGGDGTLHEVVNGFKNFDNVALGVVPCGTGNDFASAIGISLDVKTALDNIIFGTPKFTDYIDLEGVRGINVVGMGIDVDVLSAYHKLKKRTKAGYTKCLVKTLVGYTKDKFLDFTVSLENEEIKQKSFIACVCNGNRFGGGIPICPPAVVDDGELDFITVKEMNRLKIVSAFIKLKKGKVLDIKGATHKKVKSVSIKTSVPTFVNVDGELYYDIPFNATVVSNKLKMYR